MGLTENSQLNPLVQFLLMKLRSFECNATKLDSSCFSMVFNYSSAEVFARFYPVSFHTETSRS